MTSLVITQRGTRLDITGPKYAALCRYAARLSVLLHQPTARTDPQMAGVLDDLLGAVYSLIQAEWHGFTDRATRAVDIGPVQTRAAGIASGNPSINGRWVAGFYFNNALFRVAAVYHRALKICAGRKKGDVSDLVARLAPARFAAWKHGGLDAVHKQVNQLKHEPKGVHGGRAVGRVELVASIDELLTLLEIHLQPAGFSLAATQTGRSPQFQSTLKPLPTTPP